MVKGTISLVVVVCLLSCGYHKYGASNCKWKRVSGTLVNIHYDYYFLPGIQVDSLKELSGKRMFVLHRGMESARGYIDDRHFNKQLVHLLEPTIPEGLFVWDTVYFQYATLLFLPLQIPVFSFEKASVRSAVTLGNDTIHLSLDREEFQGRVIFIMHESRSKLGAM